MKFFVVFLALAILVSVQGLTGEEKDKIKHPNKACMEETGADESLVNRAKEGDFEFDDAKSKQFFLCFFNKHKMLDNEGNFIKAAIPIINEEDDRKKINKIAEERKRRKN